MIVIACYCARRKVKLNSPGEACNTDPERGAHLRTEPLCLRARGLMRCG